MRTLTQNMAIQDLMNGARVCVIDPHGDLVEELLGHVPKHRTLPSPEYESKKSARTKSKR